MSGRRGRNEGGEYQYTTLLDLHNTVAPGPRVSVPSMLRAFFSNAGPIA